MMIYIVLKLLLQQPQQQLMRLPQHRRRKAQFVRQPVQPARRQYLQMLAGQQGGAGAYAGGRIVVGGQLQQQAFAQVPGAHAQGLQLVQARQGGRTRATPANRG